MSETKVLSAGAEPAPHLVLTVHGIRTYGRWQERLEELAKARTPPSQPEIEFRHYRYGYFSTLAFIIPFLRRIVVRRFSRDLEAIASSGKWSRIDLVGHSFGTHILAWGLYRLPAHRRPRVHTVILAGSVLKANFPWRDLFTRWVERVVNDCGAKDNVLLLSQFAVLFTGMAGRIGFAGATGSRFRNRFSNFGHGGYFEADTYMGTNWVPLFFDTGPVPNFDHRPELTAMHGAFMTLANNAEPIKLAIYVSPFLLLALGFASLYIDAEERRREAVGAARQNSIQLANRSVAASAQGDGRAALILALEGVPERVDDGELLVDQLRPALIRALMAGQEVARLVHDAPVRRSLISKDGSRILTLTDGYNGYLWDAGAGRLIDELSGHSSDIFAAVLAEDQLLTASLDEIRIWDPRTGEFRGHIEVDLGPDVFLTLTDFSSDGKISVLAGGTVGRVQTQGEVVQFALDSNSNDQFDNAVALSPNHSFVAIATLLDNIYIFRTVDGSKVAQFDVGAGVEKIAFSPDGARMMVKYGSGGVGLVETMSWSLMEQYGTNVVYGGAPSFSTDSKMLLNFGGDRVELVEATTGGVLRELGPHRGNVSAVGGDRDGVLIASGDSYGTVRLWRSADGVEFARFSGHSDAVNDAVFSPDNRWLVTSSEDGTARVWDASRALEARVLAVNVRDAKRELGTNVIKPAIFSPDGAWVAGSTDDGRARFWLTSGSAPAIELQHGAGEVAIAFDPSSNRVATTGDDDNAVLLWDIESANQLGTLGCDECFEPRAMRFSPDGRLLLVDYYAEEKVRLWDLESLNAVAVLSIPDDSTFRDLWYGPEGPRVVEQRWDEVVLIRDVNGERDDVKLKGHVSGITSLAFSVDGHRLVSSADSDVRLWDLSKSVEIGHLAGHSDYVNMVNFSSDDRQIITVADDGTARIWNGLNGKLVRVLRGQEGRLQSGEFRADGKLVVTGSSDGTGYVWDAESGQALLVVSEPAHSLKRAAFSPNGRMIYTLSAEDYGAEGNARLWSIDMADLELPQLIDRARAIMPAGVTDADLATFGLQDHQLPRWEKVTLWGAAWDGLQAAISSAPEVGKAAITDLARLFRKADAAQQE